MKSFKECVPCILRQVEEIGSRLFARDEGKKKAIIDEASRILKGADVTSMTPPEATTLVHHAVSKLTGIRDFYKDIKEKDNKFAMSIYPELETIVRKSDDPLLTAIKLSIAGNVIDYGAHQTFDVNATINEVFDQEFMINDYEKFKKDLSRSKKILYIGDNAGEIVFDKLLVSEIGKMGKKVIFAVKSKPILNDSLLEDAESVEMTKMADVIESGSDTAGTVLSKTTDEFKKVYQEADMVIAKGQGNFETIEDQGKNIYFLLKCKCMHLSRRLKCAQGAIILVNNSNKDYLDFLKEPVC
ncbi:DUF89 domain-containing protein [Candidatus Margulisiibacteriota bacterium]